MNYTTRISAFFLFKDIDAEVIDKCVKECKLEVRRYSKREVIYSPSDFEKKLGLVVSGECSVERPRMNGAPIPLNNLRAGDSFGVLATFTGRDEFPTLIVAKRATTVIFISRSELIDMMKISPQISLNIIDFLADRIGFLCDKISSFSSDNVEQKLAQHLLTLYNQTTSCELKFNKKQAAESLNTGRTSLYRALEKLEERGIIKQDNKLIIILDLDGLERITK